MGKVLHTSCYIMITNSRFTTQHPVDIFSLDHKRLVLSLVLCLCSALSKEMGITVVAIFMVYEFFILNKVQKYNIVS